MVMQGEILRTVLKQKQYPVSRLAKELNITREYLYALLKKQYISTEIITTLSDLLKIDPSVFFEAGGPEGYTVIVFRGNVKTEGRKGKPWNQIESVVRLSGR